MIGTTHLFAGAALAAAVRPEPEFIATAAVAAMLPDIDKPNSKISRIITPFRAPLGLAMLLAGARLSLAPMIAIGAVLVALTLIPHRGVTHSLLVLVPVTFISIPAGIGYASHLLLDAFSGGVPLLWPLPKRFGVRVFYTSGIIDRLMGAVFLAAAVIIIR